MKNVEKAIRRAIEGGWRPQENNMIVLHTLDREPMRSVSGIFLDPDFWRALGKSEGWDIMPPAKITMYQYDGVSDNPIEVKFQEMNVWHAQMHRFIDALAGGKTAEEFFQQTL